jgi:hypothetical protein
MTQKQILELIQQHHPGAGETEIRKALNRAQDDFSSKTEILKGTYLEDTIAGQRNYPLHREMIKIYRVDIDDNEIPRAVGDIVNADVD